MHDIRTRAQPWKGRVPSGRGVAGRPLGACNAGRGGHRAFRPLVTATALLAIAAALLGGLAQAAALPAAQTVACADPPPVAFPNAPAPAASPVATPVAVGAAATPEAAAGDDSAAIELLVRTIAACQTQRRVKTLTHFASEQFLGDVYAGGAEITDAEFIAFGRALPDLTVTIVSVDNVRIAADRHATAEVVSTIGHQLVRGRWSFVFKPLPPGDNTGDERGLGIWIAVGVKALPVEVPADASNAKVTIAKNAYAPDKIAVTGPDAVISATNKDKVDHELLVVALAKGVTTQDLLSAPGPALPDGVTVIGQLTVAAHGKGALVLVNLQPGSYAVVDLLPSSDGAPYLAHGMEATLTVR